MVSLVVVIVVWAAVCVDIVISSVRTPEIKLRVQSILIKQESCLSVCVSVHVFRSHQKSQIHDIFALCLIWANLKHDQTRFSKFWFLRGVPIWYSVKNRLDIGYNFVRVFQSHYKSQIHKILALGLFWANLKHVEAWFSKFWFLRGVPIWSKC